MTRHFRYAIDMRYLPVLVPFFLRPSRDGVTLSDHDFVATFGFVKITTPRTNIPVRTSRGITAGGRRVVSACPPPTTD